MNLFIRDSENEGNVIQLLAPHARRLVTRGGNLSDRKLLICATLCLKSILQD
jgi:hypothetical protein